MGSFKDLLAYKKGFDLAMKIFEVSKLYPPDEKYNLTLQIRRSSRSVCANIAEAYWRRSSKNFFISKLHDVLSENTETEVWLDFSKSCKYIDPQQYAEFKKANDEIGKLVSFMIKHPEKFQENKNENE